MIPGEEPPIEADAPVERKEILIRVEHGLQKRAMQVNVPKLVKLAFTRLQASAKKQGSTFNLLPADMEDDNQFRPKACDIPDDHDDLAKRIGSPKVKQLRNGSHRACYLIRDETDLHIVQLKRAYGKELHNWLITNKIWLTKYQVFSANLVSLGWAYKIHISLTRWDDYLAELKARTNIDLPIQGTARTVYTNIGA
jgi:hypothetical protein